MYSQPYQQQEQEGPIIHVLDRDRKVEKTLQKLLNYQSQIDEKQNEHEVCERMSKRKIVCFGSEQVGNQSIFNDYRNKKRPIDAEFNDISPKDLFASRLVAREQLPQLTDGLEQVQMEQAEFVYQLQKQCIETNGTHRYIVFVDPDSRSYKEGGADFFAMRCLHCFKPVPDLGMTPKVINVYHTKMDFMHGQRLRIAHISELQPLY